MGWRSDLVARLKANDELAALFGQRIAFFEAQTAWGETWPQMVIQSFASEPAYSHSGRAGLESVFVQIDLWSNDPDQLEAAEDALLEEMERDGIVQGGTRFGFAFLSDSATETERLANQRAAYRLRLDFDFHWCQA